MGILDKLVDIAQVETQTTRETIDKARRDLLDRIGVMSVVSVPVTRRIQVNTLDSLVAISHAFVLSTPSTGKRTKWMAIKIRRGETTRQTHVQ